MGPYSPKDSKNIKNPIQSRGKFEVIDARNLESKEVL